MADYVPPAGLGSVVPSSPAAGVQIYSSDQITANLIITDRIIVGRGGISVGTTAAAGAITPPPSGSISLPSQGTIVFLSANGLVAQVGLQGGTGTPNLLRLGGTGTGDFAFIRIGTSGGDVAEFGSVYMAIAPGTNPAASGTIRLRNQDDIRSRNAANTGDLVALSVDSSDHLYLGVFPDGVSDKVAAVRFGIGTTALAANAFLDANLGLLQSTSSLRYKSLLGRLDLAEARRIVFGLRPIVYRSLSPSDDTRRELVGLAAEEVDGLDARFVTYDKEARPNGVMYASLLAPAVLVSQDHERRLSELERRLANG